MGFFDKLFGSRGALSERDRAMMGVKEQEISPKDPSKVEHFDGEYGLLERSIPEAHESPRTLRCVHAHYGKLVDSGPKKRVAVIRGTVCEHQYTGMPQDADFGVLGVLSDQSKFFRVSMLAKPETPLWSDEGGGIAKKIRIDKDGKAWAVCFRLNVNLKEGGVGPDGNWSSGSGRPYVGGDVIAIPADEWSVAVVPQLADILSADPVTEVDSNLPPVEIKTDILDRPFAGQWLTDDVRQILYHLLSGEQISIADLLNPETPVRDMLQTYFAVLLCLPESVARQISFGTGLGEMNYKNGIRLGHGVSALTKVYRWNNSWKTSGDKSPDVDMFFAEKYVDSVVRLVDGAQTPREVMQRILTLSPDIVSEVKKRFSNHS